MVNLLLFFIYSVMTHHCFVPREGGGLEEGERERREKRLKKTPTTQKKSVRNSPSKFH